MGQVIPRPAMRGRESRRIHEALAALAQRTMFDVINLDTDKSHGLYDSLERARGCVEFDGLTAYQIWRGDNLITSVEAAQ
jgi:hypothetical protein